MTTRIDTSKIPEPILATFRGIGQVFFQESAAAGLCFVVGVALGSPLMAAGMVAGAAVGTAAALLLKFDKGEVAAGLHGYNACLVGAASFFFFQAGLASGLFLLLGAVAATVLGWALRRHVPIPSYTTAFILTTWGLWLIGRALGVAPAASGPAVEGGFVTAVANGIGQVIFQGTTWGGVLFLAGVAIVDRKHAAWLLAASIVGALVGSYHQAAGVETVDPERLVSRPLAENIALGLYGYNAALAAVAMVLAKRRLVAPLLAALLATLLTEVVPMLGVPALTAPFVLAAWLTLLLLHFESRFETASV